MLQNLTVTTGSKISRNASKKNLNDNPSFRFNPTLESAIDGLFVKSRSGLRGLLIFLGASIFALYFNEQSLAGILPTIIMEHLGSAPSVVLINCVFGASTLSSLISIAGKIYHGKEPCKTSTHLLFRLAFYLLYFISGALIDYFNMVFISGLVVLGLQHYNVWNYYLRAIAINTVDYDNLNM